jgi:hypothetical protein
MARDVVRRVANRTIKDRRLISFKRPKRGAEADSEDVQMIS